MRSTLAAMTVVAMLALAGCTAPGKAPSPTTVPSPSVARSGDGTISGHLFAVGGPVAGSRPLNGMVKVYRVEVSVAPPPVVDQAVVGTNGSYSIDVPPGRYTLTGTSPLYQGGRLVCKATSAVTVSSGGTVTSDVLCQEM